MPALASLCQCATYSSCEVVIGGLLKVMQCLFPYFRVAFPLPWAGKLTPWIMNNVVCRPYQPAIGSLCACLSRLWNPFLIPPSTLDTFLDLPVVRGWKGGCVRRYTQREREWIYFGLISADLFMERFRKSRTELLWFNENFKLQYNMEHWERKSVSTVYWIVASLMVFLSIFLHQYHHSKNLLCL